MGLDYLNKKVWHPGSMKNIQKVWEVEQVQKDINKRARERAKKLLEEQHNDELKRIQVEAGLIPRSHLDRMEWMYDWGNKINQQQKSNEEYLTGQKKPKPGQENNHHDVQEEITNRKCEDFQLLHEDPMFDIMKEEKARRDAVVSNPIEMRNIIRQVEQQYMPSDFQQRREMHYSRMREPSPDSSEEQRYRSREKKRKHKHKREKESRKRSRHSSSRSRSSSSEEERKREKKQKKKERERERSREEHRSDDTKSTKSKGYKQSAIFQEYLKDRFKGILKEDEEGNLKPDYSMHKSRYRTQRQQDDDERRQREEKLRDNARRLRELREGTYSEPTGREQEEEQRGDYEQGVANIRQSMMEHAGSNRNHKKYKSEDFE